MKVIVVSVMIFAAALAAPSVSDNHLDDGSDSSAWPRMAKILSNCAESGDITTCLAVKGITAMNRAAKSNNIEIIPGITFVRDSSAPARSGKSVSENDIAASLPAEPEDKNEKLISLALESAADFMTSHNLEVKVPAEATQEVARAIDEGRGKMKKLMGPLMMALGAKLVAIIPLMLGGLALIATKALIVAKVAFVLAIALGASKLLGGGGSSVLGKIAGGVQNGWSGGQGAGYSNGGGQGWSAGGGGAGGYPYARSLDAQTMAYNAQVPEKSSD